MKCWKKAAAVLLLLVMIFYMVPPVHADWDGSQDVTCTLDIHFRFGSVTVSGARFYLYRVADVDANQIYTTLPPFHRVKGNAFHLVQMTFTLQKLARQHDAKPNYIMVTDEEGYAEITGLKPGAYLIIGAPTVNGINTHYVDPQVICMPQKSVAGEYIYDINIRPKSVMLPSYVKLESRTVEKIWEDTGFESSRPASIAVKLLKDGQIMDRVELSAENNWTYTWTDLLPNANWYVEEEVPEGYTVEYRDTDGVFTVINRRERIPQTGHIWWPVALLLGGGFLLVVLGVVLRRRGNRNA